jgi:hypothetical protein
MNNEQNRRWIVARLTGTSQPDPFCGSEPLIYKEGREDA